MPLFSSTWSCLTYILYTFFSLSSFLFKCTAFSRYFYPKRPTISTFVRRHRNIYRCWDSKDVHRTKCHVLSLSLSLSPSVCLSHTYILYVRMTPYFLCMCIRTHIHKYGVGVDSSNWAHAIWTPTCPMRWNFLLHGRDVNAYTTRASVSSSEHTLALLTRQTGTQRWSF